RRLDVDAPTLLGINRALAVDRVAERVDHAAEQGLADGNLDDGARTLHRLPFLDLAVLAEDDDADVVDLEIERHPAHAVLELDHFAGLDVVKTVDPGDAVTDREHLADLGDFRLLAEVLDLLFQDCRNFGGADVHQWASCIATLIALSLVRSELSTMREPSLTTSPPISEGSTFTCTCTSFLVAAASASLMAARCASLGFSASVTSAVTSPFCLAASARQACGTSSAANSRRLVPSSLRTLAASPSMPARSSTPESARVCSSAENTGLLSKRARSATSATSASKRSRSTLTRSIAFCSRASSN